MFSKNIKVLAGIVVFLVTVVILVGSLACSSSKTTPRPTTPTTSASGVSFTKDVQTIFNSNCVICHQGTSAPAGMSLEPASAYANLVNAKSQESALQRVLPGQPDKSYLVAKLQGTQVQAGGSGAQMPYGSSPLTQSQIDLIKQWITQGALNK
jgi:mono/diheme cytochrome c family protein